MALNKQGMSQAEFDKELLKDMEEFYDDPLGFVLYAFPWGKDELSEHDGPDQWQREQLARVGAFLKANPNGNLREAISSGHGVGKVQCNQCVTPTPKGNVTWGDIQVGDLVFGSDGAPTRVKAKYPHINWPFYKITFDDGSFTYAGLEHLWNVRGRKERRNKLEGWRTMSTEDIVKAGVKRPNGSAMARQWEIPVQGAAQFEEREIDLHPYVMGVWLGDGVKGLPMYSKPYPEIRERIEELGYKIHVTDVREHNNRLQGVADLFRGGVFDCYSHQRYIPDDYKFNTIENRKELLRGLLDTDGEVHGHTGSIGYSTTSEKLLEDVVWLVRSLGGKAQRQPTDKAAWYPDEQGERVACRACYRITISLPWNPFTLKHRKEAYKPSEHRYLARWIDSVEFSHYGEGHCITVEAPDQLYLANDFIVTHNTAEVAFLILWAMSTRPHISGVVTANTMGQLNTKTWRELALWHNRLINKHWFKWSATKFWHVQHPATWFFSAEPNTEHNSEAFAGRHARYKVIIFDEASGIPDKIWEVTEGAMTDPRSLWFVYGNPTKNTGRFKSCFEADARWVCNSVDSRTSRFTDKEELEEQVREYGEDSDFVRVRIRGMFPRVGSMQFISTEDVDRAMLSEVPIEAHYLLPILIGVDVARYGDDKTVIAIRQGRKLFPLRKFREINTMQVAMKVVECIKEHRGHAVVSFVDGVGVGAGVVDRLRMLGYEVIEVNAGEKPYDEETFYNKRAEMWSRMRDWIRSGCELPDDQEMRAALIGLEFGFDDKEKIRLERKKDMKKRGLPSPDEGDAIAHTFAELLGDMKRSWFEPDENSSFEPAEAA